MRVPQTDPEVLSDFRQGVKFFQVGNYEVAGAFFEEVCAMVGPSDPAYNRFRSWLGLNQAMQGQRGGLVLCRLAAKDEARDAEVFYNLARAEHRFEDIDKSLRALERGRALDPRHSGIETLLAQLDRRRPPVLRFLTRDNWLNRLLGRLTWRLQQRRPADTALPQ